MLKFLIKVVLLGAFILGLAHILPGLEVPNFVDALIFAFVLALINAFITPVLVIISYPITVLTVGIFALLINVFTFWLASLVSYGVKISTFWGAFWGGILVMIASLILNYWLYYRKPPIKPHDDD